MEEDSKGVKVVIIGAGIGGISTAINLKRKLGFSNFTIFESASEVGGTWRDNTYPGCTCDIPIHWYSLSSELNPDWSQYYADQPEILAYWISIAKKHDLYSHIVFGARVTSLTWDKPDQVWKVEIETNMLSARSKGREVISAELVVSAAGGLIAPGYADIEGRHSFRGEMFHSARWNHNIDLRGKRVGVIGNGCSATQFVPIISQDPSVKVINFCRTPNWIIPKQHFQYSSICKWVFRHVPLVAMVYRTLIAGGRDLRYVMWKQENTKTRSLVEQVLDYMKKAAPQRYHEKLTPDYPLGCKRIIGDPDYYPSLHRSNVELVWGNVEGLVEDGLITSDGKKHELDVIIFATGFLLSDAAGVPTTGSDGQTLHEYFESRGGPEAYVGTTVPGFPNLFTIFGPNVATGHASVVFSEEQQIEYALQLMEPVIKRQARSFEVRKEVSHAYNDNLHRRLRNTTWVSCRSYYRNHKGTGKVIVTFPGPLLLFWYWTRRVNWSEYAAVGAEKWERERKMGIVRRIVLGIGAVLLACGWKSGKLVAMTRMASIAHV